MLGREEGKERGKKMIEGRRKEGGEREEDKERLMYMHLTPLSSSISLNCLCRSSSDFPALSCTAFFSASATSVNWECTSTMGAPLTLSCKSDDSSMDLVSPSPSPSESESLLDLFAAGSTFISPLRSAQGEKFRSIIVCCQTQLSKLPTFLLLSLLFLPLHVYTSSSLPYLLILSSPYHFLLSSLYSSLFLLYLSLPPSSSCPPH